jgi:hypothetical protein
MISAQRQSSHWGSGARASTAKCPRRFGRSGTRAGGACARSWRPARGRECGVDSGRASTPPFIAFIGSRQTKVPEPNGRDHPQLAGTASSLPGQAAVAGLEPARATAVGDRHHRGSTDIWPSTHRIGGREVIIVGLALGLSYVRFGVEPHPRIELPLESRSEGCNSQVSLRKSRSMVVISLISTAVRPARSRPGRSTGRAP